MHGSDRHRRHRVLPLTLAQTRTFLSYNGAFTASYAGDTSYESSAGFYPGIFWF